MHIKLTQRDYSREGAVVLCMAFATTKTTKGIVLAASRVTVTSTCTRVHRSMLRMCWSGPRKRYQCPKKEVRQNPSCFQSRVVKIWKRDGYWIVGPSATLHLLAMIFFTFHPMRYGLELSVAKGDSLYVPSTASVILTLESDRTAIFNSVCTYRAWIASYYRYRRSQSAKQKFALTKSGAPFCTRVKRLPTANVQESCKCWSSQVSAKSAKRKRMQWHLPWMIRRCGMHDLAMLRRIAKQHWTR